ncbi:MAG TPA: biotin/lipoyl-binding protein [Armatimonadaceae bacterium]|nr:biotin/lipoyl-binding protein [Armatimonadaceae bacterium]
MTRSIAGEGSPPPPRSLAMVAARRSGRRVAALLVGLVALAVGVLAYVPWQQTVIGHGQVIVYSAMDRPQDVEAQIPGRLVEWRVQEGDAVRAGDVIARLEDIDSKFLDREQPARLARQRAALVEQRARAASRVARLGDQIASLTGSREAAVRTARQRVEQSRQRLRAARQALIAAQKGGEIARDVARSSAGERADQARDRVKQAEQALTAARQELETSRLQRDRIRALFDEGLRSRRDDELAENDFVKRRTDVERAELALKVARRDATVGDLDRNRADIEVERVGTEVDRAAAALDVAERDVLTAQLDLSKVAADTAAALDSIAASRESARESVAKIDSDLQKLDVERQNLARRTEQQVVTAPRDGRVVRLLRIGGGATVKAGDVLAVLAPTTADRAVELMVTDNDVALLTEGRRVRLQLAGWPALQFSGWPSAAVGTFAGRVAVIDAVDDGTARYRVIVRPDAERIASGEEQPWPSADALRPGAEATGWILLDTVSLGFELWRQFNAFPPTVKQAPPGEKERDAGPLKKEGSEKSEKAFIKIKQPK